MFKKFKFESLEAVFNFLKSENVTDFIEVFDFIRANQLFDLDKVDVSLAYAYYKDRKGDLINAKQKVGFTNNNNFNSPNGFKSS